MTCPSSSTLAPPAPLRRRETIKAARPWMWQSCHWLLLPHWISWQEQLPPRLARLTSVGLPQH